VIFQAGASEDGRNYAAARADAIFVHHDSLDEGKAYYQDIKKRAGGFGRNTDDLFILPGIRPLIGSTEAEVERKYRDFANLTSIENALSMLGRPFNDYDFLQHDLDAPFPDVAAHGANSNQSQSTRILDVARKDNLTLREVALRFATPKTDFIGTPEQVADAFQRWLEQRGSDGFVINVSLPNELETFVETVVPLLQARGIYRREYESDTFRGNLGIAAPRNRYADNRISAAAE
jgi:alkanesulfonate monooxygenase SsuD/methylene tetrahydromethanopterin reductase-like flavin-dependent oxidoreductase (luciferase family)